MLRDEYKRCAETHSGLNDWVNWDIFTNSMVGHYFCKTIP